ncbi:hypothetical protein [Enterococcus xiangfangensis]|uniref:hypothetical protein n=1 Tax=Enterococcus xiangfangensis TaxID=1296537 RepID=UPI003D18709E|nr:hypothetical protein [Enterococcus asini]
MKYNLSLVAAALSNFCEEIGWDLVNYAPNQKNKAQLHGIIIDEEGNRLEVLATQSGNYYELLGNKKFKQIDKKGLLESRKEKRVS